VGSGTPQPTATSPRPTPLDERIWRSLLVQTGLFDQYSTIPRTICTGFWLGTSPVTATYLPNNGPSTIQHLAVLQSEIDWELTHRRYDGLLTAAKLIQKYGPCQSLLIFNVKKSNKPGSFHIIRHLSYPIHPVDNISSINSRLNISAYPTTWASYLVVALLIASLPPSCKAGVQDMLDAFCSINLHTLELPSMVLHAGEDEFFVDSCVPFGAATGPSIYGQVADAFCDILCTLGFGPVVKWVDNNLFIRIPWEHLGWYNMWRAAARNRIALFGSVHQRNACLWWSEEFADDMEVLLTDHAKDSLQAKHNTQFTYTHPDVEVVTALVGVLYQPLKKHEFALYILFAGFQWGLQTYNVMLLDAKQEKYCVEIDSLLVELAHLKNCVDAKALASVCGKLEHSLIVLQHGRAFLPALYLCLASFPNNHCCLYAQHTISSGTCNNLHWWQQQLSGPITPQALPVATVITNVHAYSDASGAVGISIWIRGQWCAWSLCRGWKSGRRNIGWAKAVGFELLVHALVSLGCLKQHIWIWGNNSRVVQGWWKGRS
jgi:hypothetical protein